MCSCENAHMSLRCSRGFFLYIFGSSCPAPKMNFYTMRHGEISYIQLNNAMFIYFKMCSICKFFTIIVENIYIRFQSLRGWTGGYPIPSSLPLSPHFPPPSPPLPSPFSPTSLPLSGFSLPLIKFCSYSRTKAYICK